MINVCRLGHATFTTPDLERQFDYWTHVIGLQSIEKTPERAVLATRFGHEVIVLEKGDRAWMTQIALQVAPDTDLDELARILQKEGVKCEKRTSITPGVRDALAFYDPKGTLLEIYANYTFAPDTGVREGIMPLKLGHIAWRVKDPQKLSKFYCDILGFRVADWIGDHFSFLRCGVDHHVMNFARYEDERLHHFAFEVADSPSLNRSCDFLADHKIQLVWGPIRHLVGHNLAAYHRNPDDHRVELYCEMDLMKDEALGYFEPRPWHQDRPQYPKVWPKDTWRSHWGFGSFGTFPGYP
jgi:catechol 2,3-dioxygenase-like lactoylglutathione lyase family enzyme